MKSLLSNAGYSLDAETNIWSRSGYCSIAYSDGDEVEQRIAHVIKTASDVSVLSSELRSHCTDWPSLYHLSGVRTNILRPFEAHLHGDILEIGAGCGAITRYLGECGGNVLALEGSPRRAAIARSRTHDMPNVVVVADKFDQLRIDQRFDVITLVGVLEYANLFGAGDYPALAMLERARSLLKPDGRLIIAIENQLGLKYFAGAPEDHIGQPMYGIEGRYRSDQPQTFGRRFLSGMINQAGFAKSEFLVPFPDYKLPVCILTDKGLNAADFDAAELACQSITKDTQLPDKTLFSLERALPVIFLNGLAVELANSFLIVAYNPSDSYGDDSQSGVLAYYFSTDRKSIFCKVTSFIRSDEGDILVKRRVLSENSDPALLVSTNLFFRHPCDLAYSRGKTLYREFIEIVTRPDWNIDEILRYFSRYLEIVLETARLEGCLFNSQAQDILLPGDYLDAIPANIVLADGGKATYVDREWGALQGISLDYLLFRAITSLLGSISVFSQPQDPALATRGSFLLAVMNGLGFSLVEEDFSRFLQMESELSVFSSGIESRIFSTWSPDASLPGCSASPSIEALESRLERTEVAKSVAEELAYERLAEIQRLQTRLAATEAAKAYVETLAFGRLAEIQRLQTQLTATEAAKAYVETLAIGRLEEIHRLQTQLAATEAAKAYAETLAFGRLEELNQANGQLDAIQSSTGYKLLKIIKLAPDRRGSDV